MVIYADELQENDLLWVDSLGCLVDVTYVHICAETELVYLTARDMMSDGFVLPLPFHIANLVEVWNA